MRNSVSSTKPSRAGFGGCLVFIVLLLPCAVRAQAATQSPGFDESNVRPPITSADLRIVKRARELLDSSSKWNRADNRECPAGAKTVSLYCALELATTEVSGKAEHRGAALQEMRFVIDEIAGDRNYDHRLMRYNNDPTTTFADIQEVFRITESLITLRLKGPTVATVQAPAVGTGAPDKSTVTKTDIEIVQRARKILDSPANWNRIGDKLCPADEKTFSLYCALVKASVEVNRLFDNDRAANQEVRVMIDEIAPNQKSYTARLVDFNHDPTTTFADIQKLLQLVEERLAKRLAESASR
jgi:hypothetical protein